MPMLTSFRSPRGLPRATFAGIAPPSQPQVTPPHPRALSLAVASASERLRLVGRTCASVISELASRMRCPVRGSVLPTVLALEAHAPASGESREMIGASLRLVRGGDPASVATATWLAYRVPRRGHLHPYKGRPRARIVPPLSGEPVRRHRGVQVRACSGSDGHRAHIGRKCGELRRADWTTRHWRRTRARAGTLDDIGPPASNAARVRAPGRSSSAGGVTVGSDHNYWGDHSRERSTDRSRECGRVARGGAAAQDGT